MVMTRRVFKYHACAHAYAQMLVQRSRRSQATSDLLLRLDSYAEPGILRARLRKLLAKCRCGLIMTRRVFKYHICAQTLVQPTIIDLTSDTNNADSSDSALIDLTVDSDNAS